jgi:hypothetical protein
MTSQSWFALALVALLPLSVLPSAAHALPPLCPIPKSTASGSFLVLETPTSVCPKSVAVDEPIYAIADCVPGPRGGSCDAWPREYSETGQTSALTYQWTVRVGHLTTAYPEGSMTTVNYHCQPLQSVFISVTVRNGSYSDTDFVGFGCGDQIE